MWYIWILLLVSYGALTWRSLHEASLPALPCELSTSTVGTPTPTGPSLCYRPSLIVGDEILFQLQLYQPASSSAQESAFRWISIDSCRLQTIIPATGQLPQRLTRLDGNQNTTIDSDKTEKGQQQSKINSNQICQVPLPDFARHRSSIESSVIPLQARFLILHKQSQSPNDPRHPYNNEQVIGVVPPFFLTRIKKKEASSSGVASLLTATSSKRSSRNLLQMPVASSNDVTGDNRTTEPSIVIPSEANPKTTVIDAPFLKFGGNTPIRIRFIAEDRGYAILQRADGIRLQGYNTTHYQPIMYVDELSLPHNAQIELAPPQDNKPPVLLQIKFGSISPAIDVVNRQVHVAFGTAESFLSGPELDEVRYFLQDERLYRFALTQVIGYLHMWLDYLAFRDEIRFYRGRENLSGVSTSSVLTRLGCSVIIFLYLCDGGGTSWVVLISLFASCVVEAWKVWKLLKPTWASRFPFVQVRELLTTKERETAEYDRIAYRYLAMILYPMVAIWSLYALKQYKYSSWYSWFISNMANAVYTFGFISLCPQIYINYRLKSVAHLPRKVFVYKIFNTFVDDAFAWLIEMPLKHRLMTLRDDVVFLVFLVQVYIYRVDKSRTNEFGYSYVAEETEPTDSESHNEQPYANEDTFKLKAE